MERKLNSKTEALTVLSEELEKCRIERDHLKIILENKMLHNNYNRVKYQDRRYLYFRMIPVKLKWIIVCNITYVHIFRITS